MSQFLTLGPYYNRVTGPRVGFFEYFHVMTTSLKWVGERETLGMAGYWFRAVELGGFVFGGVIWLAFLTGSDYCHLCSRYRKHRLLTLDSRRSYPIPGELNDQNPRQRSKSTAPASMERAE